MSIRPATSADLPSLLNLERQCPTAAHWSEQQYKEIFRINESGPGRLVLVVDESAEQGAVEGGHTSSRLPAFLIANQIGPEWELENIVVAPATRRKGLATRLFTALLARARETNSESVFLEVRESNQPARAFYVRLGFEESGRRKLYYVNPQEDAVLYRLSLIHPPRATRFA
ncbi:MAG: GNAT family N-acetyltransferase [Candidatus Sulfotelmatobacter sp.]